MTSASPALEDSPTRRVGSGSGTLYLLGSAFLVVAGWSLVADAPQTLGWLCIAMLGILLAAGVPVGAAMGVAGLLCVYSLSGAAPVGHVLRTEPFTMVASWSLSVLPMFILMGLLLWRSGATDRLYEAALHWLGWLPGGLAHTTNAAGAVLGAASGSTLGITYALGRIGIPAMLAANYPKRLALSSVLMAGSGGQLIPPSIALVVYAGVASVPVGPQLLAGLVPGLILVTGYSLVLLFAGLRASGSISSGRTSSTWSTRIRSLLAVWPIPGLIVGVVVGIYSGVFTATEAGAFGAAGALVICVWLQKRNAIRAINAALTDTVSAVGSIFFLLVGGAIFSRALALSGIPTSLVDRITETNMGTVGVLLALVVVYLVLGMFLDPLAMILLTVPPLLPLMVALEVNLLWFGVFVVLMAEISFVTPPVGVLLYVVHRLAQDADVALRQEITLRDVMAAACWFLPIAIALAVVLIFVPDLALWLPGRGGSG